MEIQTKPTAQKQYNDFAPYSGPLAGVGDSTEKRLASLLVGNAQIALDKANFPTETIRLEALLMKHPVNTEYAVGILGLMLGALPPMALFLKFLLASSLGGDNSLVMFFIVAMTIICVVVGYFAGKLTGRLVAATEKWSWTAMILTVPFVGALWGLITGALGGVIVFIIGGIVGAIIAAEVGFVAFPIFAILHRLLKTGDKIERKHLYPIAAGVAGSIAAFILGM